MPPSASPGPGPAQGTRASTPEAASVHSVHSVPASAPRLPTGINVLPNELLVRIMSYVDSADMWSFLMTQRRWFDLGIDSVWMRPGISSVQTLEKLTAALEGDAAQYARLVRRLNFIAVPQHVGSHLRPFGVCTSLERLAMSGAVLENEQDLIALIKANKYLSSIDVSGVVGVTNATVRQVAQSCPVLHGIYLNGCPKVGDDGIVALAGACRHMRRIKLSDTRATADSVYAIMKHCASILELDVGGITLQDADVRAILGALTLLRDFRLNGNCHISNHVLDGVTACENLRVVDFGGCNIGDVVVERLVRLAPRLHQVSLGKCYNVTDRTLASLGELGSSLFYVHLGHCHNITDVGVAILVQKCARLQYIDVANCCLLTNAAVQHISRLNRLRRVGLVKCTHIDDAGIMHLARKPLFGPNPLERVHLSYCSNITLPAICDLINSCPKLTHLSLTGVKAFLRPDLAQFCRAPPPELTQHQQAIFCVFSGQGIINLREYINRKPTELIVRPPVREQEDEGPPNMRAPVPQLGPG